jgi:hypothetical protein
MSKSYFESLLLSLKNLKEMYNFTLLDIEMYLIR